MGHRLSKIYTRTGDQAPQVWAMDHVSRKKMI